MRGTDPDHAPWRCGVAALGGVVAWNVVAGLVLAPVTIGALEPTTAGLTIGATTVCGLTPLAAWAGTTLRARADAARRA